MITTTVEWRTPAEQMPDDDALVLVAGAGVETNCGFVDGEQWRDETGFPITQPTHWAHFPCWPETYR